MKGLIIKDFLYMKPQAKILLALLLFYIFLFIPKGNSIMIGMMMVILCSIMITNCIALDESAKWDRYACTLPISRSKIVLSRYFSLGIFATLGFVVTAVIVSVGNIFFNKISLADILIANAVFFLLSLLTIAVMLPITYKFGPGKTRIVMFGIIVLPSFLIPFAIEFLNKGGVNLSTLGGNFQNILNILFDLIPFIAIFVTVVALFLSFFISVKIYSKKDY